MSKFAHTGAVTAPFPQAVVARTVTYEGARAFVPDAKTELFTLAVTNMVGESTFYESADERDARFRNLIHQVAVEDPDWLHGMLPWLRKEANMRTAAVVAAVELARAGGGRKTLADTLDRADEPAEALAYHLAVYGRRLPAAVKRGIADAATNLYTERSALRYDSTRSAVRMADVLDITHPKPKAPWQSDLFRWLLNRRHNREGAPPETLELVGGVQQWEGIDPDLRRYDLRTQGLPDGVSWERLSGWLPGGMDAEAWEAVIPQMGYMALLRNLRNFDEAHISPAAQEQVASRLADPTEVAKSRQFPYRFYSAWKFSGTMRYAHALESATALAANNVPTLRGWTLLLVDVSGSMTWGTVSARSQVRPVDAAALFASVLAQRCDKLTLAPFATNWCELEPQPSILRMTEVFEGLSNHLGGGTNLMPALADRFVGQDRVIVLTDMQAHPSGQGWPSVPCYVWDLQGYGKAPINLNEPGKYLFGGFSDAAFKVIDQLESTQRGSWPWES